MNEIFKIYNSFRPHYESSEKLLTKVLCFFEKSPSLNNQDDLLLYESLKTEKVFDPIKAFQLIGLLHQKKREGEKIINTDKRKHFGIYYTDYKIAKLIAKESLNFSNLEEILSFKFLEPCVGTGIFVIAYIDEVLEKIKDYDGKIIKNLINQIYCADIDEEAVDTLKKVLPLYIKNKYNVSVKLNERNYFKGNVLFDQGGSKIIKVNLNSIFGIENRFDVVLTNPPYKLLKANSNKYEDGVSGNEHALDIKKLVSFIKENQIYKYNEGTLNYYKIFMEEILENYTHKNSKVGLIIPITLLNDKQSEKLRKRIINNFRLSKIYIIPEKNNFFPDISQAFCFFSLDKSSPGEVITINPQVIDWGNFNDIAVKVKISHINKISDTAPIVVENEIGWRILEKLNKYPKLGTLDSIFNARGELDLTLDKNFITTKKTSLPLLRGNNIGEFSYTNGNYFTNENFISKISGKQKYINRERIVCQQISNINLEKRLKFTKIPGNVILGNSCNFLCINDTLFGNPNVSLDYLLGILNSLLLNWRFKITNSNNHISNYELSDLPIVLPSQLEKKIIEKLVNDIRINGSLEAVSSLNRSVFKLYGLNEEEVDYILGKHKKTKSTLINISEEKSLFYAL